MDFLIFLSAFIVPLSVFYIVGFGVLSGRPVFDDFLKGAAEGMKTVAGVLPTLIGLIRRWAFCGPPASWIFLQNCWKGRRLFCRYRFR